MKKKRLSIRKALVLPLAIGCALTSFGQNTNYGINSLSNGSTYGGDYNSAFGMNSLSSNTTGTLNSAFGHDAMRYNTVGNYNTAVGITALKFNTSGDMNTASGSSSLYRNTTGEYNSAFGAYALHENISGRLNVATGYEAMYYNTYGNYNTANGAYSLHLNTTGSWNTATGYEAMYYNKTGSRNTAHGNSSLHQNTTGFQNTAIGFDAMYNNFTGHDNTVIGNGAMYGGDGSYNTASGAEVLRQSYGDNNTASGFRAMYENASGYGNTATGVEALFYGTDGSCNTALGYRAGSTTSLYNSTSLGYQSSATADYSAVIGNSNVTSIGGQVGWSTLSDGRFKENVENDVPGIEFIQKLRPVTYNYDLAKYNKHSGFNIETDTLMSDIEKRDWLEQQTKSESITYTGFIAQEVEAAANEMNYNFSGVVAPQNEADHYAIRYAEFVVPLVKATQQQQDELETLKSEIAELKQMIVDMATVNKSATQEIGKTASTVNCFPNPSTGKVQLAIENTNQEAVQINVFSATGELIYNETTNGRDSQLEIDLSNQPNGQYLIQTTMGGKYFQNRVIIQK